MVITKDGNVITIELTDDENETYEFMSSQSSVLFFNYIAKLFNNRKKQHEFDLKRELVKDMGREELKKAIRDK